MSKSQARILFFMLPVLMLSTCIDPFDPKLGVYESLLVVDGLITNQNKSYTVRLSRSFQTLNTDLVMVSDATVSVKDDAGNVYLLNNKGNGIYKTDSTQFIGVTGRTYTLDIFISEEESYQSEPCLMRLVPEIDKVYYAKDQQLNNTSTESMDGISVYLDSKAVDTSQYLRWTYDETWEFKVSNPKKYDFLFDPKGQGTGDNISTEGRFIALPDIKEFCWKNSHSDGILIYSNQTGQAGYVKRHPVNFIASGLSDRLSLKYSMLVNQYSISKDEYEYWRKLKEVGESGTDIFARQPFSVAGNIHNKSNPNGRVLGYFQVSSVTNKRIFISHSDVALMGIPFYTFPCTTWMYSPMDFETKCHCPPKTWDDVYWLMSIKSDYAFIQPIYQGAGDSILARMEFGRPECTDCTVTGVHKKPDFWDDTNL